MLLLVGYFVLIFFLSIYSFALVDPNFTLLNNPLWTWFRNGMVQFGYYQRESSWYTYLSLIILLVATHSLFISKQRKIRPLHVALIVGGAVLFSFPFLSHDFFNYMFDAKILTFYGKNPYLFRALDFPQDQWLRFMQWTHRVYPYGPFFLILSVVPSYLSFGKLFFAYVLFKFLFIGTYVIAVWALEKEDKINALFFATHPLIIIEGLVNSHNDIIGVGISILGIYFLYRKRLLIGRIFLFLSVGIKYFTFPYLFVTHKKSIFTLCALMLQIALLVYLYFYQVIQPWYFLNLFVVVWWYRNALSKWLIFFTGLLISYYPFIRQGDWGSTDRVMLKNTIITVFFALNVIYILLEKPIRNFLSNEASFGRGRSVNQT